MFNWFRQFSVISRLRALALLSVTGIFGVACALMWSSYQIHLGARQAAVQQAVEVAYATVQWMRTSPTAGELSEAQANKLALQAIDKLRNSGHAFFWVDDVQAALKGPLLQALSVASLTALTLLALTEVTVREIKTRIQPSAQHLESSANLTHSANRAMQATTASVEEVASLIQDVAHAMAASEVDQRTPQNHALVAQSAATAAKLNDQADSLAMVVSHLRRAGAI